LRNVIIATIPAGIIGVVVNKFLVSFYDTDLYGTLPIALTLGTIAALGAVFILTDKMFTGKKIAIAELGWKKPIFVGASQALAFVRGTSRSGITLVTGQMAGLNRVNAAKFSFLMSIPLIAAAAGLSVVDFLQLPPEELNSEIPGAIVILITSALSGYFAIGYMLGYLERAGLKVFGWYRILLALTAGLLLFAT
jgi:undecaprenyl-diphosphatase